MARLYTGRDKVLSAYRSYHGNTGSAIAATGDWRRVPNEFSRGHVHFSTPTFTAASSTPRLRKRSASARWRICGGSLNARADGHRGDPAGVHPRHRRILVPPAGAGRARPADEFGIVLILDEVMAGFGRTGSWFAFEQDGVVPDLVTLPRVNAGYVPAGGC